jgi:hypothetical protein
VKIPAYILFLLGFTPLLSQTVPFRENSKWGIKENDVIVVPPRYDTVFNFDSQGKVCMGCFKIKTASANKFIKVVSTSYSCNYLNKENKRLRIRMEGNDTNSVFSLGKTTLKLYNDNPDLFIVTAKNKKHVVRKDFTQVTFNGYHDISLSPDPAFYITQLMEESETVFTGLINTKEELVIPYQYSGIKINTFDSLIIACSAGVRDNANDDIYDYKGKVKQSYHRHVDLATRHFIVHKLYDPNEHYIIYNIKTREEKILQADEVQFSTRDEILIRLKHDWYIYNMNTHEKKQTKHP